jgi:hypothetical protein
MINGGVKRTVVALAILVVAIYIGFYVAVANI